MTDPIVRLAHVARDLPDRLDHERVLLAVLNAGLAKETTGLADDQSTGERPPAQDWGPQAAPPPAIPVVRPPARRPPRSWVRPRRRWAMVAGMLAAALVVGVGTFGIVNHLTDGPDRLPSAKNTSLLDLDLIYRETMQGNNGYGPGSFYVATTANDEALLCVRYETEGYVRLHARSAPDGTTEVTQTFDGNRGWMRYQLPTESAPLIGGPAYNLIELEAAIAIARDPDRNPSATISSETVEGKSLVHVRIPPPETEGSDQTGSGFLPGNVALVDVWIDPQTYLPVQSRYADAEHPEDVSLQTVLNYSWFTRTAEHERLLHLDIPDGYREYAPEEWDGPLDML